MISPALGECLPAADRETAPVVLSTVSHSRTRTAPVVLRPGSSFSRRDFTTESSCNRSPRRIGNGTIRCPGLTPFQPPSSRFSEHGLNGFFLWAKTKVVTHPPGFLRTLVTQARAVTCGALPFAGMVPTLQRG